MFLSVAAAGFHVETRGAVAAFPQPGGLTAGTGDLTTPGYRSGLDKAVKRNFLF